MRGAILVCDADPPSRAELERVLVDFEVTGVGTITEARAALEAQEYDILVIDDELQERGDGVEWLRYVRIAYPRLRRLLVTSSLDHEALAQVLNAGDAHRFVRKPWDPTTLRAAIDQLLHDRPSR